MNECSRGGVIFAHCAKATSQTSTTSTQHFFAAVKRPAVAMAGESPGNENFNEDRLAGSKL